MKESGLIRKTNRVWSRRQGYTERPGECGKRGKTECADEDRTSREDRTECGLEDRTVREDGQSVVKETGQLRKTDSVSKRQDG